MLNSLVNAIRILKVYNLTCIRAGEQLAINKLLKYMEIASSAIVIDLGALFLHVGYEAYLMKICVVRLSRFMPSHPSVGSMMQANPYREGLAGWRPPSFDCHIFGYLASRGKETPDLASWLKRRREDCMLGYWMDFNRCIYLSLFLWGRGLPPSLSFVRISSARDARKRVLATSAIKISCPYAGDEHQLEDKRNSSKRRPIALIPRTGLARCRARLSCVRTHNNLSII